MNSKVSIIIPCYNDHDYIMQSVQSALDQTYPFKEIIIIDDGSNSITKEVLKKLETKVDYLITQTNQGVSAARNKGIEKASGSYILTLDSDDYFEPEFCEKAIDILKNDSSIKIVTCYAKWFKDKVDFSIYRPSGGGLKNFLTSNSSLGNCLMKRHDVIACGGYDEDLKAGFEDWEFFIRLLKDGGFTYVIPEVFFNYRIRENSRSINAEEKKYELLKYIYLKHANIYKEHFEFFVTEWLGSIKKSESFKQKVMRGPEYKIGYQVLRPIRKLGFFKK